MKLCKDVSNDSLYHVVMNDNITCIGFYIYIAKNMSTALLALCPGFLTSLLIAWTALSTQADIHPTNVNYNFVTRIITCQNL